MPGPVVVDEQAHPPPGGHHRHVHHGRGVPPGVGEHVVQHDRDLGRRRGDRHGHRGPQGHRDRRLLGQPRQRVADRVDEVHRPRRHPVARVGARQRQQVADQPRQALGLPRHRPPRPSDGAWSGCATATSAWARSAAMGERSSCAASLGEALEAGDRVVPAGQQRVDLGGEGGELVTRGRHRQALARRRAPPPRTASGPPGAAPPASRPTSRGPPRPPRAGRRPRASGRRRRTGAAPDEVARGQDQARRPVRRRDGHRDPALRPERPRDRHRLPGGQPAGRLRVHRARAAAVDGRAREVDHPHAQRQRASRRPRRPTPRRRAR